MAKKISIDRNQFDAYSRPIPRTRVVAAIEALGFDASDIFELNITNSRVSGVAFVRADEAPRVLSAMGYLKTDFEAPVRDEKE